MKIEKRAKRRIDAAYDGYGTYKIYDEDKLIFCGYSRNVKMGLQRLMKRLKENRYRKYVKGISNVEVNETPSAIEALIQHKKNEIELNPELQDLVRLFDDYVYLATNFIKQPFMKLSETTQENDFYIGPFRSRFFIPDLIQTMNTLFQLPFCEQQEYPCIKLRRRECKGFCVENELDFSKEFFTYFIDSNNEKFKTLKKQHEQYFEDLNFSKAEELSDNLRIVEKHYRDLALILSMKNLKTNIKFKDLELFIEAGLLQKIIYSDGVTVEFSNTSVEYRENEMLAINKEHFYEMLVIYKYLKEAKPKIIDQNYAENFSSIKKYFLK